MATYTVASGKVGIYSKTLTANTVDTVTFESGVDAIEVLSKTGTAAIFFTTDGSAPTVGGQNCHEIPAVISARTVETSGGQPSEGETIQLISAGTPEYSVSRARSDA